MRIIGGQFKGFRFELNSKIPARPTTDRTKESLFNILLSNYGIQGKSCLDLFSGTGNIAYEFASHDASNVLAIDVNFNAVSFIKNTFERIGFKEHQVLKFDAFKWLKQPSNASYDLIFADPPYDHQSLLHLPDLIFKAKLLNSGGVLVIEHRTTLSFKHPNLKFSRDYGQSRFSFFEGLHSESDTEIHALTI